MKWITRQLPMLSPAEAKRVVRHLESRKRTLKFVPGAIGLMLFVGWMIVFGVGTDLLEDTKWDIINRLTELGTPGLGILFAIGPVFGIAAASIGVTASRAVLLKRELTMCLETPICVWCCYNLAGLEPHGARVRCPECGKTSPVRTPAAPLA